MEIGTVDYSVLHVFRANGAVGCYVLHVVRDILAVDCFIIHVVRAMGELIATFSTL